MNRLEQKLDSREVAEMVGKEHNKLLRDIRSYIEQLGESKIGHTDFFTEFTYKTEQNKTMPCYLVTKKGCEFIAHKLTGVKGTEFTAKYINRFHEMENIIKEHVPQGKELLALAVLEAQKTIDSLKGRCELLGGQVVEQQKLIEEMEPKANYVDHILESKSLVATTQIAKDYGMSAMRFNQILNSLKIQYKVNKQWVLYSKYQNCGYVHSKTIDITRSNGDPDVTMQTQWTQKGRLFLYEELKKNDIYPVIEQEVA